MSEEQPDDDPAPTDVDSTVTAAPPANRGIKRWSIGILMLLGAVMLVLGLIVGHVIAPNQFENAEDISVELASISNQGFAKPIIAGARFVHILAWLLPALGLAFFAIALYLSATRWATARRIVATVAIAGAVLGLALCVGRSIVDGIGEGPTDGAFARATWNEFVRTMRPSVVLFTAVGAVVLLAARSRAAVNERLQLSEHASNWVLAASGVAVLGGITILGVPLG